MSISLSDNDINYINDYINSFYNYLDYNPMPEELPRSENRPAASPWTAEQPPFGWISEEEHFYIDIYLYQDEWEEYIDNEDFKFETENINLTISVNKKPTSGGNLVETACDPCNGRADTRTDGASDANCSICFDQIKDLEIYDLKCSHSFHCECIEKWVLNKQSCPLCRVKIDTINIKSS